MTSICQKLYILLLLATLVLLAKSESQWVNENDAEEEEKELNVVSVNVSLKDSSSSDNDDGVNMNPMEGLFTTSRQDASSVESNVTELDELELNKYENDASPENAVDHNVESSVFEDGVDEKSELEETTFPSKDSLETASDQTIKITPEEEILVKSLTHEPIASMMPEVPSEDKTLELLKDVATSTDSTWQRNISSTEKSTDSAENKEEYIHANDSDSAFTIRDTTPSTNLETATDCSYGNERCKSVTFATTETTLSKLKEKTPFWVTSSSPATSIWNVVKSLKPLEREQSEDESKIPPDIVSTTVNIFESSTAQTSENLILVEGSSAAKDETVPPNSLSKNDKTKQPKTNESSIPSEERPWRNFEKSISTTPLPEIEKKMNSFADRTFPTKSYDIEVTRPVLSAQFSTNIWTANGTDVQFNSSRNDEVTEMESHFSKPSYEGYSPNSDLFTTATWYNAKSSFSPSEHGITGGGDVDTTHVSPLLIPSFHQTVTTESTPQHSSKVMTSLDDSWMITAVPETFTQFITKEDELSPTPQVEEYAPSPRLTNPECVSLPVCIELVLLETSWQEFCSQVSDIQAFLASAVSRYTRPIHPHQMVLNAEKCAAAPPVRDTPDVATGLYVTDDSGEYDERLTEICGVILRKWAPTSFRNSVLEVRFYNSAHQSTPIPLIPELNSGFVAAVAISAVAGVALCLLCILLVVMKQKLLQSRSSETTSPSADAYSLDSLSINASFRRRRTRRSARSYLNHAFSDQEIPSHPLNEKTLTTCLKNKDILEAEFKKIPMIMPKLDQIPEGAHVKNRYSNILPKPETRVMLADPSGDPLKSYINANYVKGYEGKSAFYIACQAPLPEGIEDFWRMVWEQQCRAIVMLTLFEENGTTRCATYFPQSTLVAHPPYGDLQVSLVKKEVYEFYTVATLRLLDVEKNLFRDIVHLWYTSWPDVGVPKDPSSLIAFTQQCRPVINCNSGPTVVHCSTGTGRTGVFLAIDICMREFDESRSVDILQCVSRLRRDRGGAVQNKDQYILIHEAMLEYISRAANQSQRPSLRSSNS